MPPEFQHPKGRNNANSAVADFAIALGALERPQTPTGWPPVPACAQGALNRDGIPMPMRTVTGRSNRIDQAGNSNAHP